MSYLRTGVKGFSQRRRVLASYYLIHTKCTVYKVKFASYFSLYNWPYSGADPGFFLGGGAPVSCSTSTPINHIFFLCRIPVVLENRRSSQGGARTPCTLLPDPPLTSLRTNTHPSQYFSSLSAQPCQNY